MFYSTKARNEYNQRRDTICHNLGITKNQYNWLRRKGETLRLIYENYCNGVTDSKYVTTDEQLEKDVLFYAKRLNLFVYFQTDPRGATIYLDTKAIPENNYTQAYCIY